VLLKLYIDGYLNRVQSSRHIEREAGRNVEVMWLTGRLVPDHKTFADFRKDNNQAIRQVCARFVDLCRQMGLLTSASVAIDGSKFKAVNNRDKNFTRGKVERRRAQLEDTKRPIALTKTSMSSYRPTGLRRTPEGTTHGTPALLSWFSCHPTQPDILTAAGGHGAQGMNPV
jgi:hypothetical protein